MIESFLFLFTGIVGITTIALMVTSHKSNPFYNAFLLLIIIVVSFRFLIQGTYQLGMQAFLTPIQGITSIWYLALIPCFYLYYKNLVHQKKRYNPKDLKHLIFIVFLYVINANASIKESFLFHFGRLTNFILIIGFIFFYLILIFNLLSKSIWFKKNIPINNVHFSLIKNWSIYLFTMNVLGSIALIASFYKEVNSESSITGKSMAPFLLVFWLFIFFKILTSPEILYGLPILNKKLLKFSSPTIKSDPVIISTNKNWILEPDSQKNNPDLKLQEKIRSNIFSYIDKVDKLCLEEFIFRNPKASPYEIATKLGVPTSHIVYLFKYHSNISFTEYRMYCRIQDAITLIESGYLKTNTLESLAYKTGFASYNPFFIAFKKITTHSPQDYLKSKITIAS
ncbi:helix-turn-helix domain-containing protein [Confluentibacter sediminis]|uniref:helix-turn-helix domain-containing protein n=1 Tax=Confluentibacter sediminis TaxID=2219045 RepID=UPI000DACEC45|nr:AraC family transcriptional regulator [Confluentibacter sediminis]